MNILISCIGKRGYLADYFRQYLAPSDRILGTSNTPWTPGFTSCDLGIILPDIASDRYVDTLLAVCAENQVTALLSLFDPEIDVLSNRLDDFSKAGVVPLLCSPQVSKMCFDKQRTCLFLNEHGFHTPATFASLDAASRALDDGTVTFPLIVKPRYGYGSCNVFRVRNMSELQSLFHYAPDMLVQELVCGVDHALDILVDLAGEVLSVVPKRKIRVQGGETYQAETTDQPELMDVGLRLGRCLGSLGHVGPADLDVFLDDHRPVVLEINPRFGGIYPAAHLAGADFPRLILQMIRGETISPCLGQFRTGVRMMKAYCIVDPAAIDANTRIVDKRLGPEPPSSALP